MKYSLFIKLMVGVLVANLCLEKIFKLYEIYYVTDASVADAFVISLRMPNFWTSLLVPIFLITALWHAAKSMQVYEDTPVIHIDFMNQIKMLGEYLIYAAMMAMVLVPSLEEWITFSQKMFKTHWSIEAVSMGLIGVVLKIVAQKYLTSQGRVVGETEKIEEK